MKRCVVLLALGIAGVIAGCEAPSSHYAVGPTGVSCQASHRMRSEAAARPGRTVPYQSMTCGDCTPADFGFFGLGAKPHICGTACRGENYVCPVCKEHPYARVAQWQQPAR